MPSHISFAENYREQSKYDNHLIGKVALFQFVNSFLSLFYIAFYLRDQEMLREVRLITARLRLLRPALKIVAPKILEMFFTRTTAISRFADIEANHRQLQRVSSAIYHGAVALGGALLQNVGGTQSDEGSSGSVIAESDGLD